MLKQRFTKIFSIVLLLFIGSNNLYSEDLIKELMKDSIATFHDAGRLLYYSVVSITHADTSKKPVKKLKKKKKVDLEKISPEEMKNELKKRGIEIPLDNVPIKRKEFARTVVKAFYLSKSFLTSLIGTDDMYFQDAVSLGLFPRESSGDENLGTREMLSVYLKADSLRK